MVYFQYTINNLMVYSKKIASDDDGRVVVKKKKKKKKRCIMMEFLIGSSLDSSRQQLIYPMSLRTPTKTYFKKRKCVGFCLSPFRVYLFAFFGEFCQTGYGR